MSTYIIAEAGVNHNGSLEAAKKMVDIAAEAGCDAVKFQTFNTDKLITKSASKVEYQITNTGTNETQYDMLKKLELSKEEFRSLSDYCSTRKIEFLSTPFDEESVDMLESLGMKKYKIPSGEITNKPLIKHMAKKQKPVILSTGMSEIDEIEEAVRWILEEGNTNITLLHCTSNYPAKMEDVNLRAMAALKETFKLPVGYSDHTKGIEVAIAAAAMGAEVIEKHFTIDRTLEGPDHKASLEPAELKQMVESIRNIEKALGNGVKTLCASEAEVRKLARKSIITVCDIKKGQKIEKSMIAVKRPGYGLAPKYMESVVGKIAAKDMPEDYIMQADDIV